MNLTWHTVLCVVCCVLYLECCLRADWSVAAVDVCPPPAQSPDSNSAAGLPETDGGPPRSIILLQSSSVPGPYRGRVPGACALQGCSFQVCPPEEGPVCGSANRDCENQGCSYMVAQTFWLHKQLHSKNYETGTKATYTELSCQLN